ncbi:IS1595 family transposase [Afipia birgiae]|jgi:transposase-like protein|uniref:IS1595 family transposase n=1 Tax=Afipia birgiae TaxID=151414 RepID=UPI00030C9F8A|nr:IS1595 family transposase [Afipia birgiae]
MKSVLSAPHFTNDDDARAMIESIRWPSGPVCSHCGTVDHAYPVSGRAGLYRCAEPECRKDFTCTTGTVMERSKIALHKWMLAFYLLCSSKKGMSALQLKRHLGISYQSAWFLCHRIREAMRDGGFSPMGGPGSIVEADETYYGPVAKTKARKTTTSGRPFTKSGRTGPSNKRAIVSLVERGGSVRSFHVAVADGASVAKIVRDNIDRETRLHTDESRLYTRVGSEFASHETVNHSAKEYARGDVNTNSVEGYFSIFKRGMKGVYQHCAEKHLHRYLAEFDFRYNHRIALGHSDVTRTVAAIKGAEGKRLLYGQPR